MSRVLFLLLLLFCIEVEVAAVPSNDVCEKAILLNSRVALQGSTVDATPNSWVNFCGENFVDSPGIWYVYLTGSSEKVVQVSTCAPDTNFDTAVTVYVGDDCSSLTCTAGKDNDRECDSGTEQHSTVSWIANAGERYYVLVHGSQSNHTGDFELITSETDPLGGDPNSSSEIHPSLHWSLLLLPLAVFMIGL
uniref:Peptidase C-terminal archaeal/bacterial domain-containing protein n=1 Tax=Attheya septentrionalis TaxID=420275 RepID=A0A7S2UCQ8_9STRA|mmetsp:Transcript_19324/g.35074  ORF Transcript_19324/g.35074 Transcript_19324/m.35074 type:complete len:192 (+) Transcript_19324:90-665(+)